MADTIYYVLGVLVFFAAVGCWSRWLEHRSEARAEFVEPPFVALRSPSRTNAFDRRLEAALRDASRGFRLCAKCLFTNRMRAECCVLCGCPLSDTHALDSDAQLTQRQRRARTRKDWTRRVHEDGSVVWSHIETAQGPNHPFYVLHVSAALESDSVIADSQHAADVPTEHSTGSMDGTNEDAVVVDIHDASQRTLDDIGAALRTFASSATFQLVPTTNGSRAALPFDLDGRTVTDVDWKDAVRNAAADFPTKFAQFVTSTSTVFVTAALNDNGTTLSTRLNILRDTPVPTSVDALATLTQRQARAAIRVDFVGEQGIDAGGVYREWFVLLNERILDPQAGVFTCVDEQHQLFYLNPHSREVLGENHLAHVFAAGRLVGRALLDGNATGFHLALPLLKILLGMPISVSDLEYFDSALYANLQWLLHTSDNVDALGLDFTAVEKLPDSSTRVVELVPNGATVDVTDQNKHAFVTRKLQYVLFERVQHQLVAFLKGVYDIVPPESLVLLDPEELDYLVAGSDDINVDDWERNSQSSGNLLMHPALPNFWRVVRELSLDGRRRLLQFATGATRVPPGGFSALTSFDGRQCAFTLHGVSVWRSLGYIRSHACFNRLDLPFHFDLATMRRAVAAAIAVDTVGFTAS